MPVLVLAISKDLDKLLEDGRLAAIASLRELCRVVVVAVHIAVVLVVTVLRAKDGRTEGTSEMVHVVLPIQRRDVGAPEGSSALVT